MFFNKRNEEAEKLKMEVAALRRANTVLRSRVADNPGLDRIVAQAAIDAEKLIDLHHLGYATDLASVSKLLTRRRYTYAMVLLRLATIVRGGGRGKPYRWRDVSHDEMIAAVDGTAQLVIKKGKDIFSQHMPDYLRGRVKAVGHSPTLGKVSKSN